MTQLILVMGFLGSGKTTLIKNVLEDSSERVGVVVNEFEAASVDGHKLKLSDNIEGIEVNSGSIFCACKVDFFIQAVYSLMDMGIEKIYVEASGLSNSTSIEKIMNDLNALCKTKNQVKIISRIIVADAERIEILLGASGSAIAQIQRADVVLLNKIDIVSEQTKEYAIAAIKKINPDTKIYPCVMCDVDKEIFTKDYDSNKFEIIEPKPISERSFTIKYDEKITKDKLDMFLQSIKLISVRIKGFLNIDGRKKHINVLSYHTEINDCDEDKPNELEIIVFEDEHENAKSIIEKKWEQAIGETPDKTIE